MQVCVVGCSSNSLNDFIRRKLQMAEFIVIAVKIINAVHIFSWTNELGLYQIANNVTIEPIMKKKATLKWNVRLQRSLRIKDCVSLEKMFSSMGATFFAFT